MNPYSRAREKDTSYRNEMLSKTSKASPTETMLQMRK